MGNIDQQIDALQKLLAEAVPIEALAAEPELSADLKPKLCMVPEPEPELGQCILPTIQSS